MNRDDILVLNGLNFQQLQANIPASILENISYFVRHECRGLH